VEDGSSADIDLHRCEGSGDQGKSVHRPTLTDMPDFSKDIVVISR
jgi:hypothetical protein